MSFSVNKKNAAAAAIICVFATVAVAQQTQDSTRSQRGEREPAQTGTSQSGRASTAQRDSEGTQQLGGARGGSQDVQKYLAGCLLVKNQSEIELSEFAAERAENPEVKQFAQQMVKDHRQMGQQLQQIAGAEPGAARGSRSISGQQERTTREVLSARSQADGASGSSDARVGDTSGSDSRRAESAETAEEGQPSNTIGAADSKGTTENEDLGQSSDATSVRATAGGSAQAFQQLMQIDRQIVERMTEATRNELEQKHGADFDKAFIGCAISAHVEMNAALEVIGQQSDEKLSQLAQQAQPKVQEHLEHAKQIMLGLDKATSNPESAARPSSDTQR